MQFLKKYLRNSFCILCFPAKDNFFHFKHGEDPNAIRLRVHDPIELHDLCIELPGLVCAFALSLISFDKL